VDGQDADVVFEAAANAVGRARAGGGPSLLEFSTYRYEGHHTFERTMRLRYRDEAEVDRWRARDPLALQASRVAPEVRERVDAEIEAVLDEAVRYAVESPPPDPLDAFDHLYAGGMRVRAGVSHA
jgi:TPP-dependent pyruvate/acetoin dehydrogenase alpha subunit